jgi:ribosomal protein L37AE/L43A
VFVSVHRSQKEVLMTTQFELTPVDPGSVAPISATESARRLDRLAPLLHELIAWDLVRRTESGTFEIPEEVQERLAHLSSLQSGSIAQVYVGRKCGRCGSMRVTRMVEGVRLCSTCSAEVSTPAVDAVPEVTEGGRRGHHAWSRRHRKAG